MSRSQTIAFFLRGSVRFFVIGMILSLLVALLDMIGPKIVQYTIDYVLGDEAGPTAIAQYAIMACGGREYIRAHLYIPAGIVILIAVFSALFRYLYRVFSSMGAEKLICRMRDELFAHILRLPVSWHGRNHTGDIIQRCTSDVETVRNFLSEQMMTLFRVGILVGFSLFFMISISPSLTAMSAIFVPVIIGYSVFFHNRIAASFLKADEEEGKLSSIAQENLTGVRVVRAFGREQFERERFETQNRGYTRMWIRLMAWLSAFWCSNDLISGSQIMLVIAMGAVFCVRGRITTGQYIAFVSYNGMLTWPVRELGRVISDMSKAGISIDRIRYIMNSEPEPLRTDTDEAADTAATTDSGAATAFRAPCTDSLGAAPLDIVFDHVSFSYDEGTEVLHDVNLTIPAGTTLGILGATGAGKSTLIHLLDRLYDLPRDNGTITIGGRDIRSIDRRALRKYIGLVLQEPFLLSGTLAENISITKPGEPDMEAVREAARVAALDETVDRFTDGYETYVGERGVTLSGGQKQRTAIAQIVMADTPVMIFDDSLSAVDTQTDARIRHNLLEHTAGSSVILISHRITTLMQADCIAVIDHGRIVEQGSHEELLALGGLYRHIYDIQTSY
ncbi:MAG: ABC transporter ATP-binding protein [Lachnospiraceae bacterium]|nr:ABC transporter ATP-binding protein [Lachnospiraceae bacterium]